ncbi:hypothetical protein [Serratia marcescens]|uniref:hypothetical protein n=1 Tax=Serratia marcescens TaxID=615 RepID=UPI0036F96D87
MIDKYLLEDLSLHSDEKGELARWVIQLQADVDTERRKSASLESVIYARDTRIAELESANKSQDDHINQQQDRIDSLEKTNAGLGRRLGDAEKRLATPVRLLGEMLLHDWEHRVEQQATFQHRKIAWDARLAEDKKAILAAGFTVTVEGDE